MTQGFEIVLTTVDSEQAARQLAQSLIEARLAACVQIEAIRSIYRWQGATHDEPEWRLAIKTTAARYPELEQHIKARHSYETPEIVRIAIAGGSGDYLNWWEQCTGEPPAQAVRSNTTKPESA